MTPEKAKEIVELISEVARGEAIICDNIGWGNAEKADANRKITEKIKQALIDLLSNNSKE